MIQITMGRIKTKDKENEATQNLKDFCKVYNYTIFSIDYENSSCLIMCNEGHFKKLRFPVSEKRLKLECRECYLESQKQKQIKTIKKLVTNKSGKWISGKYEGVYSVGVFKCGECDNVWETRLANVLEGKWCRKCSQSKTVKIIVANRYIEKINKEIEYYRSRQNVFDDLNKEIKARKKAIKKSKAWIDKKRKESNEKKRDKARESFSYKYKNVPEFRLNELIKAQIKKCMVKGNSMGKYYKILGYTTKELYTHLESKFTDGMSWDNIGEWHIDHITPKSWFKLTKDDGTLDKEQFKKCWSLDNLQPLWGSDNLKKGNRYAG